MPFAGALNVKDELSLSASDEQILLPSAEAPVEIRSRPGCPLVIDPEQRVAAERFGILRARLLNARAKSAMSSLLVASPQRQDGKSFTSINLAISLAQLQHERILLVDGDLRLQGMSQALKLQKRVGLADFLHHLSPFEECVKPTSLPHLYVTPAGHLLEDSLPGILEGSQWPTFLNQANKQFDFVVVDSVPVLAPIADFQLLLSACDSALLVVHMRKTNRESLNTTAQQIGSKLLGVVVNNTDLSSDSEYHSDYVTKKQNL
jgi:capsular exopolysaccharide synthesis family protein